MRGLFCKVNLAWLFIPRRSPIGPLYVTFLRWRRVLLIDGDTYSCGTLPPMRSFDSAALAKYSLIARKQWFQQLLHEPHR